MIIKIHGTSGSGKTTIIRDLIARAYANDSIMHSDPKPRVVGHVLHIQDIFKPIVLLGPYGKAHCGGLDAISGTDKHAELLKSYAHWGHVLYEGLLGSECYGAMGLASEQYGPDHVFAFLNTPIEVCISRVKARRVEKGNLKPLNEDNTRNRVNKIAMLRIKLIKQGRNVQMIDYERATDQIFNMLKEADEQERTR